MEFYKPLKWFIFFKLLVAHDLSRGLPKTHPREPF